jgi:tetratricopeptide (TPR) repeat protein
MRYDSVTIGGAVGWIVGLGALAYTVYVIYGGGGGLGLPAGRYPVILLILLFVGPPVLVGGIAGGIAFFVTMVTVDQIQKRSDAAEDRRRKSAGEQVVGQLQSPTSGDMGAVIDRDVRPVLETAGLKLESRLTDDGRTALHIAAAAGNTALVEALAERGPTFLGMAKDKLFYEASSDPAGMLAAFARGYARFVEKSMQPVDLPLTDDERALVATWIADSVIEPVRGKRLPEPDAAVFMHDVLAKARGRRAARCHDEGKQQEAIELVDSAIRLQPGYHGAYCIRGLAHGALGKLDQAIEDFNNSLRLKPDYAYAYYRRARTHEARNEPDKAKADYDEAVRLDPNDASALIDRGAFLVNRRNDVDGAIADFSRALALDPQSAVARDNLEIMYVRKRADNVTIDKLNAAIAANPQDVESLAERGRAYCIRGDDERALPDLNAALKIAPDNTTALVNRAGLLLRRNDLQGALADWSEVARLAPTWSTAHFNVGVVNAQLGNKDIAIASYRKVLELEPGAADAIANLKRLGVTVP